MKKWLARIAIFLAWPVIVVVLLTLIVLALVACWPLVLTRLVEWDL